MLLPTGGSKADSGGDSSEAAESFSLEETEKRMAEVLGTINGVGRVRIMLTLRSGSTLRLAEDSTISDAPGGQTKQEKQVLTVNRGSGPAGGGGDPAALSHLSGGGGGLRGSRQQYRAAGGGERGVCADGAQQRQDLGGQVEVIEK